MSVNPGARENEVSPLPGQMALGIVNVIQAWQMTEITPLRSMFFRKVVEGKEDAIWKVKSDFRHLSIKNILPSILRFIILNYDNLHRDKSSL